jgi:hypothetical protein
VKLVSNWRKAWKWFCMWAMGVPAAVVGVWLLLPDKLQDLILTQIPPKQLAWSLLGVLALGLVGRLIQQEKP